MRFSFSANKRRDHNRQNPAVQLMIRTADAYEFNRGAVFEKDRCAALIGSFSFAMTGTSLPNATSLGAELANETIDSDYPNAVNAAWAVASLLSSSTILELTKMMGHDGVTTAATFFTDEFPGRVKAPILGRKVAMWRAPAAVAATILISHAEQEGL